jgi:nucleotide-binding universal stress UspA family protein
MWRFVLGMAPRLIWNRLLHGRSLDVFIAHSPPFGIHDKDSNVHGGYQAFRWLIKVFKPAYFFHGHIHVYGEDQVVETVVGQTKVINTYGHRKSLLRPGQRHYPIKERPYLPSLANPAEDFRDARRRGALESIWSTLIGSSGQLLQFQQVEDQLEYDQAKKLGMKDIPLDAIVGSVSRPKDFTRKFFPRDPVDPNRWQRVKLGMDQQIRPIEVYQIDQAYFVLDGNHRVSVARQRGMRTIPAYVTKIESTLPLTPEDDLDDLIIKNQQARFRKETGLEVLRPDLEFATSIPGAYRQLKEQINAHKAGLDQLRLINTNLQEAAASWVEEIYLPLLQTVSQSGLLRDFPDRTPTDLYLWLTRYQIEISQQYGWEIEPAAAMDSLAAAYSKRLALRFRRLIRRIFPGHSATPFKIGDWRRSHLTPRKEGRIFSAVLVALDGKDNGWVALDQARRISKIEGSKIAALHVRKKAAGDEARLSSLEEKFERWQQETDQSAKLYFESGPVNETLNKRAIWNDLLVFSLERPRQDKPGSRMPVRTRNLIRNCPRPLLAVPASTEMKHGLLAYDGSPKATEALYLAAYLAEKWGTKLTVVTAAEDNMSRDNPLDKARDYLSARDIKAHFHTELGQPADVIINIQAIHNCDFLIVGGFGYQPVMEVLFGSTLDGLLQASGVPILICH